MQIVLKPRSIVECLCIYRKDFSAYEMHVIIRKELGSGKQKLKPEIHIDMGTKRRRAIHKRTMLQEQEKQYDTHESYESLDRYQNVYVFIGKTLFRLGSADDHRKRIWKAERRSESRKYTQTWTLNEEGRNINGPFCRNRNSNTQQYRCSTYEHFDPHQKVYVLIGKILFRLRNAHDHQKRIGQRKVEFNIRRTHRHGH